MEDDMDNQSLDPLCALLVKLRVPAEVAQFWCASMRQVQRFPALAGSLLGRLHRGPRRGPLLRCGNGISSLDAPRTPPALGLLLPSGILFRSYVDNWSWVATSTQQLVVSIPETLISCSPFTCPSTGTSPMLGLLPAHFVSGGSRVAKTSFLPVSPSKLSRR